MSRVRFQRFESLMAISMLRLIVTDRDRDINPNPENRTENSQISMSESNPKIRKVQIPKNVLR